MHLFYFSCDCCAVNGRPERNMMADVFVKENSRTKAETRLKEHLDRAGWRIKEVQHWELVQGIPLHDSRLSALIKAANQDHLASEFSLY